MHRSSPHDPAGADASPEVLRLALRDLHGPSLHGFALLLTLGDRGRAAALTAAALAEADPHAAELRHPERAAARLRSRVTAAAGRRDSRIDAGERLEALATLGVTAPVLAGLAALSVLERAGLIATTIERLDQRDVATIVGRSGARLDALQRRARARFLSGHAAIPRESRPDGPLAVLVRSAAARVMA